MWQLSEAFRERYFTVKGFAWYVLVPVAILIASRYFRPIDPCDQLAKDEAIPVSAPEFAARFADDSAQLRRIDGAWKGVRFSVHGTIASTGKRSDGRRYVDLTTGTVRVIRCIMQSDPTEVDSKVSKRSTIQLVGKYAGYSSETVLLTECGICPSNADG